MSVCRNSDGAQIRVFNQLGLNWQKNHYAWSKSVLNKGYTTASLCDLQWVTLLFSLSISRICKKKKKAHPPKGPPFCAVTLFKAAGYRKCSGMPFVSYSKHTFFLRLCMAFLQVLSWYCSANHFHRMVTLFVLIV